MIFPASPLLLEIIRKFYIIDKSDLLFSLTKKFGKKLVYNSYKFVEKLIKYFHAFYFSKNERLRNFIYTDFQEFQKAISNISQICLEVTQSCNLRCSYCIYSGNYKDFRNHSQLKMDFKIAKNSLDYFFSLITSSKRTKKFGNIFIGFFGGEPLLAFDLIERCVEYVKKVIFKKHYIKDRIYFHITTNGTLIKDKIERFLVDNDFLIALSLDGPQEEHDKNRLFPGGKGSFYKLWNNIERLKKLYPEYFGKNIFFTVTLNYNHDLEKMDKFFKELLSENTKKIRVTTVRERGFIAPYFMWRKEDFVNFKEMYYNKVLMNEPLTPFMHAFFTPYYEPLIKKSFTANVKEFYYTSACTPDSFRLFVSADGKFHICERINQFFPIGSHEDGIQFEKVKNILKNYALLLKKCKYCIAKHFCSLCYAFAANGDSFSNKLCPYIKAQFKRRICDFLSILEENPNAFKLEEKDDIYKEIFS